MPARVGRVTRKVESLKEAAARDELVIRELSREEYPELERLARPLLDQGVDWTVDPDHTTIVVAQERSTGKLAGFWCIFDAVHVEPLWIHPDHRRRPGLVRRLWGAVRGILKRHGIPMAW